MTMREAAFIIDTSALNALFALYWICKLGTLWDWLTMLGVVGFILAIGYEQGLFERV